MTYVSDTWVMSQRHLQETLDMPLLMRTNKEYGCELQSEIQRKEVQLFSHEKVLLQLRENPLFLKFGIELTHLYLGLCVVPTSDTGVDMMSASLSTGWRCPQHGDMIDRAGGKQNCLAEVGASPAGS